jgi:transposase
MRPYSLDLRQRIVDAYRNNEGSVRDLAERFQVAPTTVQNYRNLLRATGTVVPRPHGGGVAPTIDESGLQTVRVLLEEKNDRTLAELLDEYEQRHSVRVSRSTMDRAVRRLKFTRKKKTFRASEQDRPDVEHAREAFSGQIQRVPRNRLIFLDEFGTHLGMSRLHGRAPAGQRAHATAPCNTDPHITLVTGLSLDGVVAPFAFEGSMNGDVFEAYIRHQLAPHLRRGDVVVADGLSAHRNLAARQAIEAQRARYWILPPYSPDLSPVEECGSKIKEAIRAEAPRTVQGVYDAMGRAIGRVTQTDSEGWFRHRGYPPRRHPQRRPRSQAYHRHPLVGAVLPLAEGRARAEPHETMRIKPAWEPL